MLVNNNYISIYPKNILKYKAGKADRVTLLNDIDEFDFIHSITTTILNHNLGSDSNFLFSFLEPPRTHNSKLISY